MDMHEWLDSIEPERMYNHVLIDSVQICPSDIGGISRLGPGPRLTLYQKRTFAGAWWESVPGYQRAGPTDAEIVAAMERGQPFVYSNYNGTFDTVENGHEGESEHHVVLDEDWMLRQCFRLAQQKTGAAEPIGPSGAAFLRDVAGNPYLPGVERLHQPFGEGEPCHAPDLLDTCFLTPAVERLARSIHAGDFLAVPILGDALEDAGCTNQRVLNHCRQLSRVRYRFAGASGVWGDARLCRCPADQIALREAAQHCREFFGAATVWIDDPHHCRGCWVLRLILPELQDR